MTMTKEEHNEMMEMWQGIAIVGPSLLVIVTVALILFVLAPAPTGLVCITNSITSG